MPTLRELLKPEWATFFAVGSTVSKPPGQQVAAPKKEPLATKLTGYMPIAKMCKNCRFITSDLSQCTNKKVQQDSQITGGANGLKDIIQTGWCNEWESK